MIKAFGRSAAKFVVSVFVITVAAWLGGSGTALARLQTQSPSNIGPRPAALPESVPAAPPTFKNKQKTAVLDQLKKAPELHLQFENPKDSQVVISDVRARVAEVASSTSRSGSIDPVTRYVMDADVVIFNGSDEALNRAVFQINSPDWRTLFYVVAWIKVAGHATETHNLRFMSLAQDPATLIVRPVGATFKSGTVWGEVPSGSTYLGPVGIDRDSRNRLKLVSTSTPDFAGSMHAETSVDSKPIMANHVRPLYSEQARAHRVSGTLRLRILVGSDGNVAGALPLSFLPDFLTEEGIECARATKFKPAMKAGNPVAYWTIVEVEFSIL